jgi:hypothetical protein
MEVTTKEAEEALPEPSSGSVRKKTTNCTQNPVCRICRVIVDHPLFDNVMLMIIILNSILMAAGDYAHAEFKVKSTDIFTDDVIKYFICIVFILTNWIRKNNRC